MQKTLFFGTDVVSKGRKRWEHPELFREKPYLTYLAGLINQKAAATFAERLTACELVYVHPAFTEEHFPLTVGISAPRELYLAKFSAERNCVEVERWATSNGFTAVTTDELLTVAGHSTYRALQVLYPIVCPGLTCLFGQYISPVLDAKLKAKRLLKMTTISARWDSTARFLLAKNTR